MRNFAKEEISRAYFLSRKRRRNFVKKKIIKKPTSFPRTFFSKSSLVFRRSRTEQDRNRIVLLFAVTRSLRPARFIFVFSRRRIARSENNQSACPACNRTRRSAAARRGMFARRPWLDDDGRPRRRGGPPEPVLGPPTAERGPPVERTEDRAGRRRRRLLKRVRGAGPTDSPSSNGPPARQSNRRDHIRRTVRDHIGEKRTNAYRVSLQ